jgi:hypothetical protein
MSADMREYIDRLQMPQSTVDAMAKAVPTDVVQAIVRDNRRATPTPEHAEKSEPHSEQPISPLHAELVRVLTDPEVVGRWRADRKPANVVFEYEPFANSRIR